MYITELVQRGLGIQDASDVEIKSLVDQPLLSVYTFADMISRRAVSLFLTLIRCLLVLEPKACALSPESSPICVSKDPNVTPKLSGPFILLAISRC